MNRILFTSALCTLAGAIFANAQVPSLINYQGRLTDSNGAPVTGSKNFSLSIYDAATGGNLLYSETIGSVTLDSNGVYNFQFGNSGTSNSQVTETVATTNGTATTYTKTLSNTPVVANSITVTDGTNSWSQSVGNPGSVATATANTVSGFVVGATITSAGSGYTSAPAVTITGNGSGATATATISNGTVTGITITNAGSGYTTGATITIAPPVIPFRVDYSGGAITATYSSAPASGRTISATYRYGTSGITDALGSGSEHWIGISIDGVIQGARQRVLAVPFATNSQHSQKAGSADKLTKKTGKILNMISFNNMGIFVNSLIAYSKAIVQLPISQTVGTYSDNIATQAGALVRLSRTIDQKDIHQINKITAAAEANLLTGQVVSNTRTSEGYVSISLIEMSQSGENIVLSSDSTTGSNKTLMLDGPFLIDQRKEYRIDVELRVSDASDHSERGYVVSGTHAKCGVVSLDYDTE